jgi:nucleotide-binding universal stress UspA family protein
MIVSTLVVTIETDENANAGDALTEALTALENAGIVHHDSVLVPGEPKHQACIDAIWAATEVDDE